MVKEITSDILLAPVNVIIHQANCMVTMNSGIARILRDRYPQVYEADQTTRVANYNKLGTFSLAEVTDKDNINLKYVANLYSQFGYGTDQRHTDYNAFAYGLERIGKYFANSDEILGVPYRIGSNRAGGDWNVIKAIIHSVFDDSKQILYICKHPDEEKLLNQSAK